MKAASGNAYLGAAIFAGAAVVTALAAMLIHDIPHPSRPLSTVWWERAWWSASAGLSAALSFLLVRAFDWRLRLEPLWGRALVVGLSTVAVGHLLIGIVAFGLLHVRALVWFGSSSPAANEVIVFVFGVSVFSVVKGWYFTLPLGIAAAALEEVLERRREAVAEAKAAE